MEPWRILRCKNIRDSQTSLSLPVIFFLFCMTQLKVYRVQLHFSIFFISIKANTFVTPSLPFPLPPPQTSSSPLKDETLPNRTLPLKERAEEFASTGVMRRRNYIVLTSMRHRHVALTSVWCHFDVMCLVGCLNVIRHWKEIWAHYKIKETW